MANLGYQGRMKEDVQQLPCVASLLASAEANPRPPPPPPAAGSDVAPGASSSGGGNEDVRAQIKLLAEQISELSQKCGT